MFLLQLPLFARLQRYISLRPRESLVVGLQRRTIICGCKTQNARKLHCRGVLNILHSAYIPVPMHLHAHHLLALHVLPACWLARACLPLLASPRHGLVCWLSLHPCRSACRPCRACCAWLVGVSNSLQNFAFPAALGVALGGTGVLLS